MFGRTILLLIPGLVMVLSAIGSQVKYTETSKVPATTKKDLGEKAIDILSGATRVEVFRLERKRGAEKATPKTIGADGEQWTITATAKEKDKEFAAKVRGLLFNEKLRTNDEEFFKRFRDAGFGIRGDVAFRLWKDKESVTVVMAYDACTFLVVTRDAEGKQTRIAGGGFRYLGGGGFDVKYDDGTLFGRAKALAVEAFPDDKAIEGFELPPRGSRPPVGDEVPVNLLAMLEKAESFELYSLDPERQKEKPKNDFHGWMVLGQTTVKEAETRKKLMTAFKKGVEDNDGAAAACFRPRHGIRVTHDQKTADFVICYECLYMQVYIDEKPEKKGLRTTGSPAETFNGVLKEAKVPLPEK